MIPKSGFSLLFILLPVLVFGQANNTEFRVFGNGEEMQLPDTVQSQIKANFSTAKQTLLQWFTAKGFLNAKIDSLTPKRAEITQGCAFYLDEIRITYSGDLDSLVVRKPQINYTQQILKKEIQKLILDIADQGYPFAKSEITRFDTDDKTCSVSVELEIDTGQKASTYEVYFSGAHSNSPDYLRKISRFRNSQIINPDYLKFLRSNLIASELFNYVGEGQIFISNDKPIIVFEVEERSLNQFNGLVGYVPDTSGKGQLAGDIQLSLWNVLTQGNGVNFHYQRLRPENSELDIGVTQDWISGIPIGLSAGFELYQNDTTYQSREFELGGYYRINRNIKLIGSIGYQATTSGTATFDVSEPDGKKRSARLGFEFTNLDNYDVPTRGNSISLSFGISNKDLKDDSAGSFVQNSLHLEARKYIPILNKSVIAFSLSGFLLEADKSTINDLIRFGGANSFRGFAEDQFRAGRLLWGDMEYRFLINRSSYLFAFGAVGGYHRPKLLTETTRDFETTDYIYSTGFGLSYQTRIGRLKFTYAISPEESIANGKVHFGIKTEL